MKIGFLRVDLKNVNLVKQSNDIMARKEIIRAFHRVAERKVLVKDRKTYWEEMDRLFEEISAELPDIEMSEDEIQAEINAYRDEQRRNG